MENETLTNKTISGLIWKFLERSSAQLVSFIVSVILARLLFPDEYGVVSIVLIFISLANTLITNGIGTSLVQKKDADEADFSTMFWSSLALSVILYFILFFLAPVVANIYDNNLLTSVLRVMGLILPISSMKSIQNAYVSKKMIFKKFFLSTFLGTIISAVVGIVMAYLGYGVWALVAQYLTNATVDTIVLLFTLKWKPKFIFCYEKFKSLFSYGWKIMATSFIGALFNDIRALAVGYKYSAGDLAYQNKGEHIPNLVVNNINDSIENVTFPALSKIQDDTEKMKKKTKEMIKLSNLFMMPILFGIASVARPLTILLFTEKWIAIVPFIQVACITKMFAIITTLNIQAIKAKGHSEVLLKLEFIKKPIYLTFILIGLFISPIAVAIANMLYGFIGVAINAYPNRKYLRYSISEQFLDILPSLASALIMFMGVIVLQDLVNMSLVLEMIIAVIAGIIIYAILTLLIQRSELKLILQTFKTFIKRKGA